MACAGCLIALSGPEPDGYTVRRSVPFGDEPTQAPSTSNLLVFAASGVAAYLLLSLALPATAKRFSR
jgi:hypothetical protein